MTYIFIGLGVVVFGFIYVVVKYSNINGASSGESSINVHKEDQW